MRTLQSKTLRAGLFATMGLFMSLAYQNCGGNQFEVKSSPSIVDAACNVPSGCQSADSSSLNQEPDSTSSTPNASASPTPTPVVSLYNFVALDKATCEASIFNTFGKYGSCTYGGGCGLSCGKPGSTCPSANPSYFGACLAANDASLTSVPPVPPTTPTPIVRLYNFVAPDKATCEASIFNTFGRAGTCSIGGGCGTSCGIPGPGCPSANPSSWGACLKN